MKYRWTIERDKSRSAFKNVLKFSYTLGTVDNQLLEDIEHIKALIRSVENEIELQKAKSY